jgi:hypothetical protein
MIDVQGMWKIRKWIPVSGMFLKDDILLELKDDDTFASPGSVLLEFGERVSCDDMIDLDTRCNAKFDEFNIYGGESPAHGSIGFVCVCINQKVEWLFLSGSVNSVREIVSFNPDVLRFRNNNDEVFDVVLASGRGVCLKRY